MSWELVKLHGQPLKRSVGFRSRYMALKFSVCRVDEGEKHRDYVTLVTSDVFKSRGLVLEAMVGVLSRPLESDEEITQEVFVENQVFVKFMHDVIARHADGDCAFEAAARGQAQGWVYVIDQRTPNPAGPVPPEDVVGAFEVLNGKIIPNSYQPNPRHRIFSSTGFFDLGLSLNGVLLNEVLSCYPT